MLVTGDNSLQLFLGWEGVGLASYLLIHFWFTRLQADKAAIKAMLVNRVGDFGLAPGILGCFTLFQTVDFSTIFARASAPRNSWISCNMRLNAITLICILLFIGAVGKSAQIGSHTWSPDAMEGPTPVSALIHAATMVTAGVFMIARCSPLFEYPPTALIVITFAGAMTSFLAATTGILQNDLKRVIAYSTCSQLGYMIFACGISNYSVSVFHLMNHAFFKALLFLSAGSVIHAMSDVKLNSDGRCRDGICGGGGVVRDSMGALIMAYSIPLGAGTSNWAEAKAMLFGLKWCIERRYRLVIGETYSLLLSSCTSRMCPMLLKA
ncbi:hypothetical protein KY285_024328 [Solanum tuberosum]|nr:hypothetical protein KY285_024328 [Solanum tuberosum]